jgi:cation diffusion facilitator family transporter
MIKNKSKKTILVDLGLYYSLLTYIIAASTKIFFGSLYNASSLFADGVNSLSDVISSIVIIVGLYLSRKPRDSEHAYGHYRIEQVATIIAAAVMFTIGIQTLINGGQKIFNNTLQTPDIRSIQMALLSVILIASSAIINFYLHKKTNSASSLVIAQNNISDTLTAFGTIIAIGASQFNMPIIDTIASLIIAIIIIKTAINIFLTASNSLIDGFDAELLNTYKTTIEQTSAIQQVIDIRGRMLGNETILDVTITVDSKLSVYDAHIIADSIEHNLQQKHHIAHTNVHIEPDTKYPIIYDKWKQQHLTNKEH